MQDAVWYAYFAPYPFERHEELIAEVSFSFTCCPHCCDGVSAVSSAVLLAVSPSCALVAPEHVRCQSWSSGLLLFVGDADVPDAL